jgi:uracil-DNA glycosylase
MSRADYPGAAEFVPAPAASLADLASAAQACHGCDLFQRATQAVFGTGPADASVLLVGEQPGDAEDRQGKPFVGPAGQVLDRALADAGIAPETTYTTNAVKHFRWRTDPRGGKRRIHQKPEAWQVRACWPWLAAEIGRLKPQVVVTLGATAGQALFGSSFRVGVQRGTTVSWHPADGTAREPAADRGSDGAGSAPAAELTVVPTIHPSAVLRADDREASYTGLVDDLKVAAGVLHPAGRAGKPHA